MGDPMRTLRIVAACAAAMLVAGGSGEAHAQDLGTVDFVTSCAGVPPEAFDRAVALLHHMTYSGARSAFAAIAESHPDCGMAHWGVAMTLFQPLWPTRPSAADLERGWQEVQAARSAGLPTGREQMYVAAVSAFFDPARTDYWDRIRAWAAAMAELVEAYPDDVEARAFFALSHLAVPPAPGDTTHGATAAAVLATILRDRPAHPGAIHYTIHANDAAGREHESLDVVRGYATVAPRNPHALHMPTHIFVRLGEWQGVIDGNRRAAEAALENPAGDAGQWVWDEFPHAIEYLVYAYLQVGDDAGAAREMNRLRGTANLEPTFKTAFHLSSIPARDALERRDWAAAAKLEPRPGAGLAWENFPWPEAVTWFARGIGSARSGDAAGARAAEARLTELRDASARLGETLFATQTEILRLGVAAWLAHLDGDAATAVQRLEQAATLENTTPKPPVTPAPTLPAHELLGDLLLELGRPADALRAYQASLAAAPGRLNSLAGAARAATAAGDVALAARLYEELRSRAIAGSTRAEVLEARAITGRRPMPEV